MKSIAAFVAFQVVWFACAYSDVTGFIWLGPLAALIYLGWIYTDISSVFKLAGLLALAGALADTLIAQLGLLSFVETAWPAGVAPLWLIALWAAFAGPLLTTFDWLVGRPALGALLGGVGGPLAYVAGEKIGALTLADDQALALAAIGIEWAIVTPLGVYLGQRLRERSGSTDVSGERANA